jgi:hypothetical protein
MAKASSGAAFVNRKKAAEARIQAQEEAAASGHSPTAEHEEEDIFELQHHHLLRCLEKTTVSDKNLPTVLTFLFPPSNVWSNRMYRANLK